MRSYQSNHQEGIANEDIFNNLELIARYSRMFDELLDYRKLSSSGLFEACSMSKLTITQKPVIVAVLLRSPMLPPFMFLLCSN
jgi:hypothetical protein